MERVSAKDPVGQQDALFQMAGEKPATNRSAHPALLPS